MTLSEDRIDSLSENLSAAALAAADRIANSSKGWPGAQVRWLFFTKSSRRGMMRSIDGQAMVWQWFVYVKGSSGIWLGQDGLLYTSAGLLNDKLAFYRIGRDHVTMMYNGDSSRMIKDLDKIQP